MTDILLDITDRLAGLSTQQANALVPLAAFLLAGFAIYAVLAAVKHGGGK